LYKNHPTPTLATRSEHWLFPSNHDEDREVGLYEAMFLSVS